MSHKIQLAYYCLDWFRSGYERWPSICTLQCRVLKFGKNIFRLNNLWFKLCFQSGNYWFHSNYQRRFLLAMTKLYQIINISLLLLSILRLIWAFYFEFYWLRAWWPGGPGGRTACVYALNIRQFWFFPPNNWESDFCLQNKSFFHRATFKYKYR